MLGNRLAERIAFAQCVFRAMSRGVIGAVLKIVTALHSETVLQCDPGLSSRKRDGLIGFVREMLKTLSQPPSLASLVAEGLVPIRLERPWRHPRYRPKPQAEQPLFRAYLGVPIVRLRKVPGVLEVQRKADRQFDEEDSSLLLTLSFQLVGLIERVHAELSNAGQPARLSPVGIMIEVPAAVFRIDALAAHADFVSIGQTRDLWRGALKEHSANGVRGLLTQALDEKGLGGLVRPGR